MLTKKLEVQIKIFNQFVSQNTQKFFSVYFATYLDIKCLKTPLTRNISKI